MTWKDVTALYEKADNDFEDGTIAVIQQYVDSIKAGKSIAGDTNENNSGQQKESDANSP